MPSATLSCCNRAVWLTCWILCTGCTSVVGAGPVIGIGRQASAGRPATTGLQIGAETSAGIPVAPFTVGALWVQSHGVAYEAHVDLGWDSAYDAASAALGGAVGIGAMSLGDSDGEPLHKILIIPEVNGAIPLRVQASDACPFANARSTGWGTAISLTLQLRINWFGWSVALAPRYEGSQRGCATNGY